MSSTFADILLVILDQSVDKCHHRPYSLRLVWTFMSMCCSLSYSSPSTRSSASGMARVVSSNFFFWNLTFLQQHIQNHSCICVPSHKLMSDCYESIFTSILQINPYLQIYFVWQSLRWDPADILLALPHPSGFAQIGCLISKICCSRCRAYTIPICNGLFSSD